MWLLIEFYWQIWVKNITLSLGFFFLEFTIISSLYFIVRYSTILILALVCNKCIWALSFSSFIQFIGKIFYWDLTLESWCVKSEKFCFFRLKAQKVVELRTSRSVWMLKKYSRLIRNHINWWLRVRKLVNKAKIFIDCV